MNGPVRLFVASALALLAPALVVAQGGPPQGKGMGPYDPSTVVSMSGTVVAETRIDRGMGHKGVHLTLKTADGEISVHLGPDFWVDEQKTKISKGDQITVKGSKVTFDGKPALIAQSIRRGGETIDLRDTSGKPLWSGPPKK